MEPRTFAEQIEDSRGALLDAWLARVLSRSGSQYRQLPADQVRSWLSDAIDAELCLMAEPGSGTTVRVVLPLAGLPEAEHG